MKKRCSAGRSSPGTGNVSPGPTSRPVTVTDPLDRLVTGLEKDNFEVFEGKEKQQIRHLSSEDAPASVGILIDMSGNVWEWSDACNGTLGAADSCRRHGGSFASAAALLKCSIKGSDTRDTTTDFTGIRCCAE